MFCLNCIIIIRRIRERFAQQNEEQSKEIHFKRQTRQYWLKLIFKAVSDLRLID